MYKILIPIKQDSIIYYERETNVYSIYGEIYSGLCSSTAVRMQ